MHPLAQLLVFGVFLFFGWISLPSMFWNPLRFSWTSETWQETRCTIVSSRVVEDRGGKGGTSYHVDFEYTYQVNGRAYEGTRYSYRPTGLPTLKANRDLAARHARGARVPCWFDPEAPGDAVLDREVGWTFLAGIFPLIMVVSGAGGILWTLGGGRARKR